MKTVAQLIEELKELPQNAPVYVAYAMTDEDGEEWTMEEEPKPYLSIFGKVWL